MGALAVMVFVFTVTYALAGFVHRTIGLRVSETKEYVGLDLSHHGERAY